MVMVEEATVDMEVDRDMEGDRVVVMVEVTAMTTTTTEMETLGVVSLLFSVEPYHIFLNQIGL